MNLAATPPCREELCRILHDANTGRITPDESDPTRYAAMADAVLDRLSGVNLDALPTGSEVAAAQRFHAYLLALTAAGFSRDEAVQILIALIVAE